MVNTPGIPEATVGAPFESLMTADPTGPGAARVPRPGRHRGDHLHVGNHGHPEGRRAHALPAVHELRHPGPGVRHPRRRRHPRRAAAVPRVRAVEPAQRGRPLRRDAVPGPPLRGRARCSRSSSATGPPSSPASPRCSSRCWTTRTSTPTDVASLRVGHLRRRRDPGGGPQRVREEVRRPDPRGLRPDGDRLDHHVQHQRRRAPGLQRRQADLGRRPADLGRRRPAAAGRARTTSARS